MNPESLITMLFKFNNAEMAEEAIQNLVTKYKPLFYIVLRECFGMYKDLVANDDFFTRQALMKKNMYDAYCSVGFTPEQAMMFILDADVVRKNFIKQLSSSLQDYKPHES